MRSANLAIVFVDIAGFTARTGQQSRAESQAWLARYEQLLLPLIKAFEGLRIKSIGDAFLCTFASPTNALLFGMAAQDRLYDYNQGVPEAERIEIRVAVNAGEVRIERKDVFGEPVNIAARVEGLAPVGEIWFTESVYLAMTRSEVPAEEVGLKELKGIAEPVRIYRVSRASEYKLESASPAPKQEAETLDDAGPEVTRYPYGGLGLKRLEDAGGLVAMGEVQAKLAQTGRSIGRGIGDLLAKRGLVSKRWMIRAGMAAALLLFVLLVASLWPSDPFSEIREMMDSGQVESALAQLDKHPAAESPAGKACKAHGLLVMPDPDLREAASLIMQAIKTDPLLADEEAIAFDLVQSMDKHQKKKVVAFLVKHFGDRAKEALLAASSDKRYWLRWNSLDALKSMDALDEVDLGLVYLQDLRYAGSCSTRKRAAKKLAELGDKRALDALRQAKKGSLLTNLCMGSTLDEAIKTIQAK
ncbi:MAG: adenylate/guanylate cyclase domain-containing protein [Deltaproteobacteria bacterium]|nr:adenylate/guanylate cyclase domain-containing protein [Deltaproteobacteria bacterium]